MIKQTITWYRCDKKMPAEGKKVLCQDEYGNVVFNLHLNGEWIHHYARMIAWAEIPRYEEQK